jgi:hypothetical protein
MIFAGVAATALLWTAGCATEENKPKPPQPGSPEMLWKTAQTAYTQGDYVKASNLLGDLAQKENAFTAQAAPLALVLNHGLAHAYAELGEKYAAGAKRTKDSAAFYRLVSEYRSKAAAAGLRFVEVARKSTSSMKEGDVTLAFDLPAVKPGDPPQYKLIETGRMIPAAEIPAVEAQVVAHWALLSTANAVGQRDKPEKAKAAYSNGEAKVPQEVFLSALAFSLFETAEMFGPRKLNQPNRVVLAMCNEAEKVLGKVKPTKENTELLKKVKALQKKTPA